AQNGNSALRTHVEPALPLSKGRTILDDKLSANARVGRTLLSDKLSANASVVRAPPPATVRIRACLQACHKHHKPDVAPLGAEDKSGSKPKLLTPPYLSS